MRTRYLLSGSLALALAVIAPLAMSADSHGGSFDVTATAIEGCSCPMFCSCYYNSEPTGGHKCQFNNAYRMADGSHWGEVDLSGAKIWMSGDLGGHFADGTTEWAVVTFDRSLSQEQRDAIGAWAAEVFPVQWGSMETREDEIAWHVDEAGAHAELASGLAKIDLERILHGGAQATVTNTPYWGADSNDGFELAYSTHEYNGEPGYLYEKRNGFIITIHSSGAID